jgi:TRAP-type mannitol/chloroaromatic compound transport system substrate-binding protein
MSSKLISGTPKRSEATSLKAVAPTLSRTDVHNASDTMWRKLQQACDMELNAILGGDKELNASTIAAVTKFLDASRDYASSIPAEAKDFKHIWDQLPTFDDDGSNLDAISSEIVTSKSTNKRGRPKKASSPPPSLTPEHDDAGWPED